jgi:hypothetical protein
MHPFAQHVKHYAATLITHPMYVTPPVCGSNIERDNKKLDRRKRIISFLKPRSRYTVAIAQEIGMGGETMLQFLQVMAKDGLVTMERGAQQRCLWSVA